MCPCVIQHDVWINFYAYVAVHYTGGFQKLILTLSVPLNPSFYYETKVCILIAKMETSFTFPYNKIVLSLNIQNYKIITYLNIRIIVNSLK